VLRPVVLRLGALALLGLLAAACGPAEPPPSDRLLLHLLEPRVGAGAGDELRVRIGERRRRLAPAELHRLRVARSEREAAVTAGGVSWRSAEPLELRGTVAVSVAALGPAGAGASEAVLRWHDGGEEEGEGRELLRAAVAPADGWRRVEVSAPAGAGRIELTSTGGSPVAWAELHALAPPPADQESRASRPDATRPDVVLISIDTLRADHLSAYGYPRPTTPHLDRLAGEAYLFTRAFSSSTWTLPATATLLTGLLPGQHGVRSLHRKLPPEIDTLAERLERAGYRTAAITDGGFVDPKWGFGQGFGRYDATAGEAWAPKDVRRIVESAERFLAENRFHPYFLFLHTYETHKPYRNPEGFADPFLDPDYRGRFRRGANFSSREPGELTGADVERIVALYDGEVRRADHHLGAFLDRLRSGGRWRQTAVVVTSDHGEEFLDHGGLDHGFAQVFDPNVRVPLIVKPPGDPVDGRRVDARVTGVEVVPTILELAGVEAPRALPGRSLLGVASGDGGVGAGGEVGEPVALVHGTNSFPDLHEERLRLDRGDRSVIFDRVRGELHGYDLAADPEMRRPASEVFAGPAAPAAERLQTVLAWLEGEAELLARLPDGAREVAVGRSSKVAPRGVWNGLERQPGETSDGGGWHAELDPGRPHYLVFSPRRRGEGWTVEVATGEEGALEPLELHFPADRRRATEWNPLVDPPPEPGVILPGSALFEPGQTELTEESVEELRALGYLQ